MHLAKHKLKDTAGLFLHDERGLYEEDTINHSNECIDKSRTHLNYNLAPHSEPTYEKFQKMYNDMEEMTVKRTGKHIRKDAVTMCSWIVTVPKDLPEDKHEDFFKYTYEFLNDRYGEENVLTATVHNDEITPHLHYNFMPIVEENGVKRLCANNMETPASLKSIHRDLQKYLEKELQCPVNILNGATIGGNKSIEELKAETLKAENKALQTENEALAAKTNELKTNALEFECSPKKFMESNDSYDIRVKTHQQATAVKQRGFELDQREHSLDQREQQIDEEIEIKSHKKAKPLIEKAKAEIKADYDKSYGQIIENQQQTIQQMQLKIEQKDEEISTYKKYGFDKQLKAIIDENKHKKELDELKKKANRFNGAISEGTGTKNNYTFANNENYDHSKY